jgi:hypothetical protein
MPGAETINRTDIVVFNWPVDVHYFFEPKGRPELSNLLIKV